MFENYNNILELINKYDENEKNVDEILEIINKEYNVKISKEMFDEISKTISDINHEKEILAFQENKSKDHNTIVDYSTDIIKTEDRLYNKERKLLNLKSRITQKICISSYNGTLTKEDMEKLDEIGYDGTYGNETVREMFSIYKENKSNKELLEENKEQIIKNRNELNICHEKINEQNNQIISLTATNNMLQQSNNDLKKNNESLKIQIQDLSSKLSSLSNIVKEIPKQMLDVIKEVFKKEKDIEIEKPKKSI